MRFWLMDLVFQEFQPLKINIIVDLLSSFICILYIRKQKYKNYHFLTVLELLNRRLLSCR